MSTAIVPPFRVERLAGHNRKAFASGEERIDTWFATLASQHLARGLAVDQVLIDQQTDAIAGLYSLSNYAVRATALPDLGIKRLPQNILLSMHLLGYMGVDRRYQGKGIGRMLVSHALKSAAAQTDTSGSLGVVVQAFVERLVHWYEALGFVAFPEQPLQLVMPMPRIRTLP